MGIKLNHISKNFGDKNVIENFTIEFPDPGITVLMAPSGAGKTTILRLIAGLEKPDKGEVVYSNKVAVVFQESRLFPWLNAIDNVITAAGVSREKAAEILTQFNMGTELTIFPEQMSGGMQRRVALARAFAYGGALLLDEPFNGIDDHLKYDIIDKIKKYAETQPVVMITHNMEEAKLTGGNIMSFEKFN